MPEACSRAQGGERTAQSLLEMRYKAPKLKSERGWVEMFGMMTVPWILADYNVRHHKERQQEKTESA